MIRNSVFFSFLFCFCLSSGAPVSLKVPTDEFRFILIGTILVRGCLASFPRRTMVLDSPCFDDTMLYVVISIPVTVKSLVISSFTSTCNGTSQTKLVRPITPTSLLLASSLNVLVSLTVDKGRIFLKGGIIVSPVSLFRNSSILAGNGTVLGQTTFGTRFDFFSLYLWKEGILNSNLLWKFKLSKIFFFFFNYLKLDLGLILDSLIFLALIRFVRTVVFRFYSFYFILRCFILYFMFLCGFIF
jgi:hypothetical protein